MLRIARQALEAAVFNKRYALPPNMPAELTKQRAGAFVTLVRRGKLRACWGTLEPQHRHLAEEIAAAAQAVRYRDGRFPPVRADELRDIRIILTIVNSPLRAVTASQIRPRDHGIWIRLGDRSAVVLPHEGRTVRRMLSIARQKAGIAEGETVEIYAFRVLTLREER